MNLRGYDSNGRFSFSLEEYVARIASDLSATSAEDLPDFLILSPPRTGTTWLAQALREHPDVYIPPEKELRYFDVGWRFGKIEHYVERYATGRGRLRGDASPTYVLLPEGIIRLLRQAKPSLKCIVMLRDLDSRAWSNFRHSLAVGEFGLRSGGRLSGPELDEAACRYLVSDYCTSVGDYAEYLGRWLRFFEIGQFCVVSLTDIDRNPLGSLQKVHEFLGLSRNRCVGGKIFEKMNVGAPLPKSERIGALLRVLYKARHHKQRVFFQQRFGMEVGSHFPICDPIEVPYELVNRADGYKVVIRNGRFYACWLEDFPLLASSFLNQAVASPAHLAADHWSELEGQIHEQKHARSSCLTDRQREDARLVEVLNALALDYPHSNEIRLNVRSTSTLKEYRGFNLVAMGDVVIGLRQSLGPVDLTVEGPEALLVKYGPRNVVVAGSVEEGVYAVEVLDAREACEGRLEAGFREQLELLAQRVNRLMPEPGAEPRLLGEYQGYNLVAYEDRIAVVSQKAGPVDFRDPGKVTALETEQCLTWALTLDGARGAVDRIQDACRTDRVVASHQLRMRALEARQEELERRVVEQAEVIRRLQDDQRLVELERQQAALASRVVDQEDRLRTLEANWIVRLARYMMRAWH